MVSLITYLGQDLNFIRGMPCFVGWELLIIVVLVVHNHFIIGFKTFFDAFFTLFKYMFFAELFFFYIFLFCTLILTVSFANFYSFTRPLKTSTELTFFVAFNDCLPV